MRTRAWLLSLTATALVASPAAGQGWESPTFFSSAPPEDIGFFVTKPEGADAGFTGIWRQGAPGSIGLGVRAGFTDLGDSGDIFLGAEFYGGIGTLLTGSELEASWYTGVGAGFGSGADLYRVPLGVSVGMPLGSAGVRIRPYAMPRAVLDLVVLDDASEDDTRTDVDFALDLGADVAIGERLVLKAGATLTGAAVFGLGLTWRMSRGVSVR